MSDKHPWTILGIAALLGFGSVAAALLLYTERPDQIQTGLLATARISACFFIVVFVSRPLLQLTGHGLFRFAVVNRRYLGLSVALVHSIHLGFILVWANSNPELVKTEVVIIGGVGYLLLYLQAATSNDDAMRLLGRNWSRLHTVGVYYLWFVYLITFAGHPYLIARVFTALLVMALAVRLYAMWKKRRPQAGA